jgi:hypothetical protein
MKSDPQALSPKRQQAIQSLRDEHLSRQFGDEIARVAKLPLMDRYRYVAWMIDNGRRHGVKNDREPRGFTE